MSNFWVVLQQQLLGGITTAESVALQTMATTSEKLASSLDRLNGAVRDGIVQSRDLTRHHIDRLVENGFLVEAMRGWYYVTPLATPGSTAWYGHHWSFIRQYLEDRFGEDYCLSAEASLDIATGKHLIPRQLLVVNKTKRYQNIELPNGTSLSLFTLDRFPEHTTVENGIRIMSIPEILLRLPEMEYQRFPDDLIVALNLAKYPSQNMSILLAELLNDGRSYVAGRLVGAFRHIGESRSADHILMSMKSAGHDVRESNPFTILPPMPLQGRVRSPYVARLQVMWAQMRKSVEEIFPREPGRPTEVDAYLAKVDERRVEDAYNSLSIEGYHISADLIEKIRSGNWNPDAHSEDQKTRDALAAKGYADAFQVVRSSLATILRAESPAESGAILDADHQIWYQTLFGPLVRAGILPAGALAGYRSSTVYIKGSLYVPPGQHNVVDMMEALFDLIAREENAAVRALLGHFFFVYIHPYHDGNGRMARFLMNALFASGGFPWTVIHLENRERYMAALEMASVKGDIRPFAECVWAEMPKYQLEL